MLGVILLDYVGVFSLMVEFNIEFYDLFKVGEFIILEDKVVL